MLMPKKLASPQILEIYFSTKARLQAEQAKADPDLATNNNIEAFAHILRKLEELYDISGSGRQAA